MSNTLDRIRRTFGLSVDNRFVSKLITTQYDDLKFEENGRPVHPEMEDILQLFGAMEQFSEDATKRMEKLDMPELSADAQKEMEDVLDRIAKMARKAEAPEQSKGMLQRMGGFVDRLTERSKGNTRERFAAVFKSSVEVAMKLGEQVRAEQDYLHDFGVLEEAMGEGTVLAAEVRKRQNARTDAAIGHLSEANARLEGMDPGDDDYARTRRDAMQAQKSFDLENRRKLFATELYTKMSSAYDFSCMLAVALAQKTATKQSLWIAMTNSLNTQQTTFSLAQANISSLESLREASQMKTVLDRGNVGVVNQIGQMSVALQQRATLVAHSGGLGVHELKTLAHSIAEAQRTIAPMRQKLIEQGVKDAENVHQASLTFQRDMRTIVMNGAQNALSHQKDNQANLTIGHARTALIEGQAVEVAPAVDEAQPRQSPRMR